MVSRRSVVKLESRIFDSQFWLAFLRIARNFNEILVKIVEDD